MELDVIGKVASGIMSRQQGQQILAISERTLRRYLKSYSIMSKN